MKAATKKPVVRPKKPRILVVGGEPRNMQSKRLHELFEITHIDRTYKSIPALRDKEFDGVAILPWKEPWMIPATKRWADSRNIHAVEVRSVGQMGFYLGQKISWIKTYLEDAEKKGSPVSRAEAAKKEKQTPAPGTPIAPARPKIDEDELWEAYGEKFVQDYIRGLDGTETNRVDFVKYMKDATGLADDEHIDVLISVMRLQGVITEENGVVAIGKRIQAIDLEKKRKFIASGGARPSVNHEPAGIRSEIRGALAEEEKESASNPVLKKELPPIDVESLYSPRKAGGSASRSGVADDEVMGFFKTLAGDRVFDGQGHLFRELFKIGLKKRDGKPLSAGGMRNYLARAISLGVSIQKVGKGHLFRVMAPIVPEAKKPQHVPVTAPAVQIPEESLPKTEPLAAPIPAASVPQAPPVSLKEYFSKPGKIYDGVCANYPGKKIPDLAGLEDTARVVRALFWAPAWDKSAARTILSRLKLPVTEENLSLIQSSRQDFNDEEWSYFSLEYLRDQPLGSLFTVFSREEGVYRKCTECQEDFYARLPRLCRNCYEKRKNFIEETKRGGDA